MSEIADVKMIPVSSIRVINPRVRNKKKFAAVVSSIAHLGLKRPISVCRRNDTEEELYDLVCGQGRLEAVVSLGWTMIPAIVRELTREQLLLRSLVENLARNPPNSMAMPRQVKILRERGYSNGEIAHKLDVTASYVSAVTRLMENGEERLLREVDKGNIAITAAILIATTADKDLQSALTEAYEKNQLRGKDLLHARKLAERRKLFGKGLRGGLKGGQHKALSSEAIVRAYKQEAQRQKLMIKKAKLCETRLLFIVSAFRQLFGDDNYLNLLRAEGLDSLPRYLADQIQNGGIA